MLGAAVCAGLTSAGVEVVDLGIAPTPAVSFTARTGDYGLGVVVSASHNPAPDNGIKFFGHDGRKLDDAIEERIEGLMDESYEKRPEGRDVGWIQPGLDSIGAYLEFLAKIVPERLDGMKIAVDAAHGAAYVLGPEILRRLGAETFSVGIDPDGININAEGGATKPEFLIEYTRAVGADVGVAFDGDADRAVFCDGEGRLINGDRMMGAWATYYQNKGSLNPPILVGTVMSNGGFEHYLSEKEIKLERAPVGDKYVSAMIEATGARIGGEQSGHIIFPAHGPTGDGLATALEFFRVLKNSGQSASEIATAYEPWPQLLVNVTVASLAEWKQPLVSDALARAEERLRGVGRVVVRPSGTQPMVRVMVEARDGDLRDEVAESVVEAMRKASGGEVYSRVDLTHALGD